MNLELFDTQTDPLTIHHKGVILTLNQRLIKEQDLSASQINDIINLHKSRIDIEIAVKLTPHLAKEYFQQWTDIQNGLQLAWGFLSMKTITGFGTFLYVSVLSWIT